MAGCSHFLSPGHALTALQGLAGAIHPFSLLLLLSLDTQKSLQPSHHTLSQLQMYTQSLTRALSNF